MRFLSFILCIIIMVLPTTHAAWAHGVRTQNSISEATVVTILHDDGSPLAFADFTVHSPLGGPAFSQGKTDSQGRVVFLPNKSGPWEIKVFSPDGHGAVTTVDVTLSGANHPLNSQNQNQGQMQNLITGVGILFGIFGLLVLIQNRKPAKE